MPTPESQAVQVLRQFRARMDAQEEELMRAMGARWLEMERQLQAEVNALAAEMALAAANGETVTPQTVRRSERYQELVRQMDAQVDRFNAQAVDMISSAQERAAVTGIDSAKFAILASYPSPLSANFNRIFVEAVESMIGFAGDGSPLLALLQADFLLAAQAIVDALISGIALGKGAAQIARDMINAMGIGFDRAMLIARTETQRAYRTGSVEQYRQSGVVDGFMRLVKKDGACLGCLMLDGEKFESADELDDHPNGRCTAVPIVAGMPLPTWEQGKDWFVNQPESKQREIMGNTRFELWQNGMDLEKFASKVHDEVWGSSPRPTPVSELQG